MRRSCEVNGEMENRRQEMVGCGEVNFKAYDGRADDGEGEGHQRR